MTRASWIAHSQGPGACATRPPRRRNQAQIAQPSSGSTNSEWLAPRCRVISATGSSVTIAIGNESRSGRVPRTAPASIAARRCPAGTTAPATAAPSTSWERESIAALYGNCAGPLGRQILPLPSYLTPSGCAQIGIHSISPYRRPQLCADRHARGHCIGHHRKYAATTACGRPDRADVALLARVLVAPAVAALVLDHEQPPVLQFGHEV